MKKATISLIFLIASILTFTNQLLNPEHQSGSHRISNDVDTNNNVKWSPYPSKAGPQKPVTIDTTEADKIKIKLTGLQKMITIREILKMLLKLIAQMI